MDGSDARKFFAGAIRNTYTSPQRAYAAAKLETGRVPASLT